MDKILSQNFGDLSSLHNSLENSKIVVIPVPYDGTSTWIKGADKGPSAIIEASGNLELYDISTDSQVYEMGIHTAPPVDGLETPEETVEAVYATFLNYLKLGKFPVIIGGEHSVSIGAIKASFDSFDKLTVLQLDAHADLRDEYMGSKYNHACVMARAREMGPIVQVGIRSMSQEEKMVADAERIYYAEDIVDNDAWMDRVIGQLTDNVYITIDLDVFDPSVMPSTGTPEPGGLGWYQVLKLLDKVIRHKRVVAFDVVELCPNENDKAPDFLAAKLIYRLLSKIFQKPLAKNMDKKSLLQDTIEHVDITSFDSTPIIDAMRDMAFSSGDTARAADILLRMLRDDGCTNILTLAGSTSAAGCMKVYADMVKYGMVDIIVATGASIVDMDFFEALGFRHYKGTPSVDDKLLRNNYIDRIYDVFIDEEELQECDMTIKKIANGLEPKPYSSREIIREMGRYLCTHAVKKDSLVQTAFEHGVPIFCPAFTDSSAGFGLVKHQVENPGNHLTLDAIKDFLELTRLKIAAQKTGLFMVGGGVPKNFTQDIVICAEILGHDVPMHQYAVQITVADVRDGGCSSSTLKEASSWGKVDTIHEQMVYAEASTVMPLIVSYAYHQDDWKNRKPKSWSHFLDA